MKRQICLLLAVMMMFSMLVLPALALAQEVMHDDCDCHAHAVGETVEPMAECNHEDWVLIPSYIWVQSGCKKYEYLSYYCTNCGDTVSNTRTGNWIDAHKGPYSYVLVGTDESGNIYRKKCDTCGNYV